jgi:co-chaperonin GroES (HSP10)
MTLNLVDDRVLVLLDKFEETWSATTTLVRPDIGRDKPTWGVVLGVGPGRRGRRGNRVPTGVRRGERVYVPWATGHDLKIDGQLAVVVRARDILAVDER